MKWVKLSLLALIALGSITTSVAWADRGGHGGGFHSGGGFHGDGFHHGGFRGGFHRGIGLGIFVDPFPLFYGPAYYPYPYPYYPDVVVSPAPAVVYPADPGAPSIGQSGDWYYCRNPDGYYPAIKACPSGWQRVPAQAPSDR